MESEILPVLFKTYRKIVSICSKLPCHLAAYAGGSTSHQCAALRLGHPYAVSSRQLATNYKRDISCKDSWGSAVRVQAARGLP